MAPKQRYISPFLTHFVGRKLPDHERYDCLAKILNEGRLTYPPHDQFTKTPGCELVINYDEPISEKANEMYCAGMVCFCDIPVGDLGIHTGKYGRFGLAFDKDFIAKRGGAPVYYVPKEAAPVFGARDESGNEYCNRGEYFDDNAKECSELLDELMSAKNEWSKRARRVDAFLGSSIFAHILCFDHNLDDSNEDNYYFEREWRVLESLKFHMSGIRTIFLPREGRWARRFREDFPDYCGELILL